MVERLLDGDRRVSVLDPCVGRATFPLAIAGAGLLGRVERLTAVDVDDEMVALTQARRIERVGCVSADYLAWEPRERFERAILNPPYVRQEWLDGKEALREKFRARHGVVVPGTSNLFVYFLVKVLHDLEPGGRFACIVYDSWQSTRFGEWLVAHLRAECASLECEPVPGAPFEGRLIDATILYGEKARSRSVPRAPLPASPRSAGGGAGLEAIDALFSVRRGLRLKQADFFLCGLDQLGATPFVKKSRLVPGYAVPEDHAEAALLATKRAPDPRVRAELERRLEAAARAPDENVSILTWHRERPAEWFAHRAPPRAPILFNYYLRNRPRHIYNQGRAFSDNFYGLTPRDASVPVLAWVAALQATAVCAELLAHGRNQGDGLVKLQLFEYRRARVPDLRRMERRFVRALERLGRALVGGARAAAEILDAVDALLARATGDPRLEPTRLRAEYAAILEASRRPKEGTR